MSEVIEQEAKVWACGLELKTVTDAGTFEGHAAVIGNVDLGGDKIEPGAFVHTIKETGGEWPILMAHRQDKLIGFNTKAEEDKRGLLVAGEFTLDSPLGAAAYASAKHAARLGQKLGLSIGYGIRKNGAEWDEATNVRRLKDLNIYEYSIAPVPMNQRARIGRVKAEVMTVIEIEEALRDAGFSVNEAKRLIFHMSALRDAGGDEGGRVRADCSAEVRKAIFLNSL